MDSYLNTAENILQTICYITLATTTADGQPWNTPVFSAVDSRLTFYWSSSPHSQHSQNIQINNRVFIVIYDSRVAQGTGWGVYLTSRAYPVRPTEVDYALALLGDRRKRPFQNKQNFLAGGCQQIYKALPNKLWINDAQQDEQGEFVKDYRVELDISSLKQRLG